MKRTLTALALLAAPMTASAGVGFTAHLNQTYTTRGYYYSAMNLPTVDITNQGLVIQIHALDLIEGLTYENLDLGVNVYKTFNNGPVNDNWKGVFQPGGSLDVSTNFDFDPLSMALLFEPRLGFQKAQDFGFGLYVVPGLGFGMGPDGSGDTGIELAVSGGLQVAAWM